MTCPLLEKCADHRICKCQNVYNNEIFGNTNLPKKSAHLKKYNLQQSVVIAQTKYFSTLFKVRLS